jgi:hypothetical protein
MTGKASMIAGVVLLAFLASGDLSAQGVRSKLSTGLSTVTELHLETGSLSEEARRCGLASGDLETPARRALEATRLTLIQSATNFLFVNATVAGFGDACVAAIDVELFRWSRDYQASVSVWAHKTVITGGSDGFSIQAREKVDALTREFIAEWTKARR